MSCQGKHVVRGAGTAVVGVFDETLRCCPKNFSLGWRCQLHRKSNETCLGRGLCMLVIVQATKQYQSLMIGDDTCENTRTSTVHEYRSIHAFLEAEWLCLGKA